MNYIIKARSVLDKIILAIGVVLLSIIIIFIGAGILFRTLGVGLNWTEEFARFSYVGVTFLGSVIAINVDKHIVITFLADILPGIVRKTLGVLVNLSVCAFMIICTYGQTFIMAAQKGVRSDSVRWFHLNYLNAVVLAGCALMAVYALIKAVEIALNPPAPVKEIA